MRRGWIRILGILMVLALVAAACGDDDDGGDGAADDGDGGGGDAAGELPEDFPTGDLEADLEALVGTVEEVEGETTRGVSDDTIRVGGVSTITAGGQPVFFGMCEGTEARLERANRDGELSRQIDFVDCVDDGSNQDTNEQAIEQLVLEDEVFALLPMTSQAFFSEDFLNEEHAPYVGWGFQPAYCGYDKPFGFAHTGSVACPPDVVGQGYVIVSRLVPQAYIDALEVDDPSQLRVAVITEDAPTGRSGLEIVQKQAELEGFEVVFAEASVPPPTAPPPASWAPFATDILESDPDVVFLTTSQGAVTGLSPELRNQGYEGDIAQFVFADPLIFASPELAQALDTTIGIMQGIGVQVFGGPEWEQAMSDAEEIGFEACCGTGFVHGYASADFFVQSAAAYEDTLEEGDPFTTEGFANFVNGGYEYPGFGNVVCGGEWPISHFVGYRCASTVQWDTPNSELIPLADMTEYDLPEILEE